jgi:hypothetical protein
VECTYKAPFGGLLRGLVKCPYKACLERVLEALLSVCIKHLFGRGFRGPVECPYTSPVWVAS